MSNRGVYDGVVFMDKINPLVDGRYDGGITRFFMNHRKISAIKVYPYNDISYSSEGVPCTDVTVMYKNGRVMNKTHIMRMTIDDAHVTYHTKLNIFEKILSFFGKEFSMKSNIVGEVLND